MAVIKITHTTRGFNAINYVLSGKAHVKDKYVNGRVMTSSSVNCTVRGCKQQMNAVWKRYGINRPTKRHRRQIQRLIQSFDPHQLDYRNPSNVAEANNIGRQLAHKLYPHRQSIIITQADNKNHVLHNHILTNMLDFRTGRSMTSCQTNFYYLSRESDKVIRTFGLNPTRHKYMVNTINGMEPKGTQHQTNAEYHLKQNGRYSWVNDLRKQVNEIAKFSNNWNGFIYEARKRNITVDPYRKHKGKPRLDQNGHPVFKAHITYKFNDKNGKPHKIRDRKMGHAYSKDYLSKVFNNNRHLQIYYNATSSESQRAKNITENKQSLISDYRSSAVSEAQPLINHQIIESTTNAKSLVSASASKSAKTSLSKTVTSLNNSLATSAQQWQISTQSSLQISASQFASNKTKMWKSSADKAHDNYKDWQSSAGSAYDNYENLKHKSNKIKKEIHNNKFEFQYFIQQQIQIADPDIDTSDAMGYAMGMNYKFINGKNRTGLDYLTNLISSNIEHKINPAGTVQIKNNFDDYSKNHGSSFLQSLNKTAKTDNYNPDKYIKTTTPHHQFNLARSNYWRGYSRTYYRMYKNHPNPYDRSNLNQFQFAISNMIRRKEQNHNQVLTPRNKIERKIDERVNADPNDAQNYTHPWYVRGFDVPQDSGPQF